MNPVQPILFVVRFVALWLFGLALMATFPGIEQWAVAQTYRCLLVIGVPAGGAQPGEPILRLGSSSLLIIPDCTPLMPVLMLLCAITTYPAPFRWKMVGALAGVGVLWIYNIVRVLALGFILDRFPRLFAFAHVYLWQTMTLVVVFGLFILWLARRPPHWFMR